MEQVKQAMYLKQQQKEALERGATLAREALEIERKAREKAILNAGGAK